MSKYGNGVSMRSVLEMEYNDLNKLLNVEPLTEVGKEEIRNIFKNLAYDWCKSNAHAVAVEKVFIDQYAYNGWAGLRCCRFDRVVNEGEYCSWGRRKDG